DLPDVLEPTLTHPESGQAKAPAWPPGSWRSRPRAVWFCPVNLSFLSLSLNYSGNGGRGPGGCGACSLPR
ncbi:Hypothetical predicted protein, partial [Marmota monax]